MIKATGLLAVVLLTLQFVDQAHGQGDDDIMSQTRFGAAAAVTVGDVLIGEPGNRGFSGFAYVFRKSDASGAWEEVQRLMPVDGKPLNGFGSGIASSGNLAVVVATNGDDAGAYVYRRDDDKNWKEEAVLRPTASLLDSLGAGLAVSDDRIFLTVFGPDDDMRVVVYEHAGSGGSWTQSSETIDLPAQRAEDMSRPLAVSDSLLFVGAPSETGGVVFVMKRDRHDWFFAQMLKGDATEGEGESLFGAAIAVDGERLLIGAPAANDEAGLVYAFEADDAGVFEQTQKLTAFGDSTIIGFGSALALRSGTLLVGSFDAYYRFGAVHLFEPTGSGKYEPVRQLEGRADDIDADFGTALAVDNGVAVIGARTDYYGYGTADIYEETPAGGWERATTVRASIAYRPESVTSGKVKCEDDQLLGYECRGLDMVSFLSNEDIGNPAGIQTNDVWGWTDPDSGKEYAIVGTTDATIFIDISDPEHPIVLGRMAATPGTRSNWWRDAKTYKNFVYVVADEVGGHGLQIFDLTQLRDVENPPVEFEPTAHYDAFGDAHNIVIDEETGFAYVVGINGGGETCGGGSHILDLSEPAAPVFVGCFAHPDTGEENTGYTHDAQCVVYHGPDERYTDREICIAANENAISVADVTDKENIIPISVGRYPNSSYVHQGWLTEDHRYFFQNDENDELDGLTSGTRTLVWDLAELDDPVLVTEHVSENPAVDHNLYIKGSLMYQSNYLSGLRVFDISNPQEPVEIGYFDTVPWGDDGPGFGGSWSNYPFFKSGVIVVSSLEEGVFFLKRSELVP